MQAWRGVQEKQISGGLPLPRMPRPVRSSLFGTAMSNLKTTHSHLAITSLGSIFRQDAMPKLPPSKESCQVRENFFWEKSEQWGEFLRDFESFCDVLDLWTLTFFWCCKAGANVNSQIQGILSCSLDQCVARISLQCHFDGWIVWANLPLADFALEKPVRASVVCFRILALLQVLDATCENWLNRTHRFVSLHVYTNFFQGVIGERGGSNTSCWKQGNHTLFSAPLHSVSLVAFMDPTSPWMFSTTVRNKFLHSQGCLCVFRSSSGLKVWEGSKKHTPYLTHRRSLLGQVLHRSKKMWGCSCLFPASKLRKIHSRLNL